MKKLIMAWLGLVLALSFTLFFSFQIKSPCLSQPWGPPRKLEYRNLCYNDIQALYGVRKLDQRALPYIQEKGYEYPVLMGLVMWTTSLFAHNHVEYYLANLPLLTLAALVALAALAGAMGPKKELLWFAAGTPLLFYAYLNWDLLAVAFVCLTMWAWKKGRLIGAGTAIGLGVAAKIYPVFFLPPLVVALWNDRGKVGLSKEVLRLFGAAVVSWLAVNLPIILADYWLNGNINGWTSVFTFHARRTPDFGTIWYWLSEWRTGGYPTYLCLIPPLFLGWATLWFGFRTRIDSARFPLVIAGAVATGVLLLVLSSDGIQRGPASGEYKTIVDHASELVFGLGVIGLLALQWFRKRDPWTICGAILALYLIVSKIHSPQHALWILPLMVAVRTPPKWIVGYFIADALVFAGGDMWIATSPGLQFNSWQTVFIAGVFLRALFLGIYGCHCCTSGRDRFHKSPGEDVSDDHRTASDIFNQAHPNHRAA